MSSPSSIVRRRAWINSSRQWPTVEDLDPEGPLCNLRSASISDDDVFSDGCVTGKIETWLQRCGPGACLEPGQLSVESVLRASNLDDDLSLGADASVLNSGEITFDAGLTPRFPSKRRHSTLTSSTPRPGLCLPSLSLGHSLASSCLSSSTCKTTSSVSEVLQMCAEDAAETLYELGFGCDEPQVTVRIPPRFFTFPSHARGINFRLFLDSQIRRIREEDPSLSLASRFRQVQVLTAMANAFYELYSHVSRTPLQKLATPEFSLSSPVERIERFRSSVRSEPRSPVERLKDTVSKMCLYTGSPRGSDSTSPQASPKKRASLPDVVGAVLRVRPGAAKNLELEDCNRSRSAVDVRLATTANPETQWLTEQTVVDTDARQYRNKLYQMDMKSNKQLDNDDGDESRVRTSLASSLSGETVIEMVHQVPPRPPELELDCSPQGDTRKADVKPAAKATYELICPQIVESVHQAPFCCQRTLRPKTDRSPDAAGPEPRLASRLASRKRTAAPEPQEDASTSLFSVPAPGGSYTHYCITVRAPDSGPVPRVPPVQTCEESFTVGTSQYLNPLTHRVLGQVSTNLRQVNSFELEEVHSAGEDDLGPSEPIRTSLSTTKHQSKGEVVRGDSVQSDSSGYADEEPLVRQIL
ncbi:uncharacterized protein tespa1 [Betta splendens]|uniref:Uncharacterized protein tespa1 n=1 Tax=Betta splendens TaxID=158456 RepID=A0A6P7MJ58_BETSP|nr:uncharacterized protein tespa1 [Betta splendens]